MSRKEKRQIEKSKKRTQLLSIVLFLCIATLLTFSFTTSRYIGQIDAENDSFAKPILTISDNNTNFDATTLYYPGDTMEYDFKVSNKDGENINEVLLKYNLTIKISSNVPLTTELYSVGDDDSLIKITLTDGGTPDIEIGYEDENKNKVEIVQKYKLKLIWNKSDNSSDYAGQTITCNINLSAEQET